MGAKLKKHLAWILSISLILGNGGFGFIGDIISWAEVGVKEQGIVASDSQAYERTEIEGSEEGADGEARIDEEARADVEETGVGTEIEIEIGKDEAGKDETDGDGTDKGEISRDEISKDETSQDRSDEDEADKDVEMGDEELYPYGYATKSDASVHPDHAVSEDKGDDIDGDLPETDIDVADLIDAEDDTYGYEHVTPDGIKILVKVTESDWPEDTQIQVVKVTGQEQERVTGLVEDALEKEAVSMVYAYDISFWSKGETFEPEGEIEVTFQFPEEEKERFKGKTEIFHVKDEEDHADIMQKESETELEVSCLADGFSVYGVAIYSDQGEYIKIYSASDLYAIKNGLSKKYILMNDIEVRNSSNLTLLGDAKIGLKDDPFTGTFDGNGHRISCNSVFDYVQGATIKDVIVEGDLNWGNPNAGLIVNTVMRSEKETVIANCTGIAQNSKQISGTCVGGIVGKAEGNLTIENCTMLGDIKVLVDGVGGILGGYDLEDGEMVNVKGCKNYMSMKTEYGSDMEIGGIVSIGKGGQLNVVNCTNYGNLVGGDHYAGGACGAGIVSGIAGEHYADGYIQIRQCENQGDIVGFNWTAGIFASSHTSGTWHIRDCYNNGNISTSVGYMSGIVAGHASIDTEWSIQNCYNAGNIDILGDGRSVHAGNIYGYYCNSNEGSKITNVYAHEKNQGKDLDKNVIKILTENEMRDKTKFKGFNFDTIWDMGGDTYKYPTLKMQGSEIEEPEIPDEEKDQLKIQDCSPWQSDKLYWDSDIRIEFNKEIYGIPGEGCDQRFAIKEYVADTTMFEWDPSYSDYSIEGNVLTLHNALVGCREQTGLMYYLYIPDGFFKSAADPSELLTGYEEKGRFTFVLSYPEFPDLHFVQFKYKKDGEMILYYYQAVDDGKTCIAPNGPVWEGHRFVDWYVDEDLKTVFDFTTPIHRNYILYAKYIDDPNVPSGSVSGGGNKSKHEHNDIFNSTARDSGFVEVKDPKTGTVLWKCYQNGEPVTGYVQNFYYNGVPGSFLFDENGIMLTGWHRVNGQLRYFDETPGHRGYEITARDMADRVTKNSAYKYLGSYTFASTFANDLDMLDATAFLIVNYSDVEKLVKKWILTGQDQVAANEDWARIYLKQIIDSLCDTQNPGPYFAINDAEKQGSREASKILTDLVKTTEFSSVAEMYEYMKKATDYSEDILDKMFANYTSNICMLDSYARICPEMRSVIEELKAGYTHSVRLNLRKSVIDKMVDEFDVKNIAKGYNELKGGSASDGALTMGYSASDAVVNKMIAKLFVQTLQEGVKSSTSVSRVENVIYSAYTRTQAINALRRAEQSLQVNPDREDALNDYVVAFNIAKEATRIQYWNIFEYYNMKGETEKASKAYEGYRKLSGDSFYSY